MKNISLGNCQLQHLLQEISRKAVYDALEISLIPEILRSKPPQTADYQTAVALSLAKDLKKSPREVGQLILSKICHPLIEKVELAGPGFINIYLSQTYLEDHAKELFEPFEKNKHRVLIDYSSPNVAKELHVGHLRSTIIGDSLARLFELLGYKVMKINHIGDFGTQFGMLVTYIIENQLDLSFANLVDLMEWYRASKVCFDEDAAFKKRSQEMVVRLQSHEEEIQKIWKKILDVSRLGFEEIYQVLDVDLLERGESFYQPYLKSTVDLFEKKGLVEISGNAKCVFLEGYKDQNDAPLPLIIQKSDGGFNYATTDLAALKYRIEEDKADKIIYVTDAGQSQHLHMVFDAAKKCGFYQPEKTVVEHAPFGLVLNPDGTKMKTRSGEVFRLIDLIKEAVGQAKQILVSRYGEEMDEDEVEKMAKILGVNAIKYADLSSVRTKDYIFSFERMLRFEGNTAAFNLYSYVRIKSILKKCKKSPGPILIYHPTERKLLLALYQLYEAIDLVQRDLMPHRIAEYLYHLAETFNEFFRDCRVEGAEEEPSRISLLQKTLEAFEWCFGILGLKTLERM
ncbi:MAG: arginine--tRNA ligase [Chlamydiae bacterium]|nr:arginine--tRNA ligase [Chlamydiota bacterium]